MKNRLVIQTRPVFVISVLLVVFALVTGLVVPGIVSESRPAEAASYECTSIPVEIYQMKSSADKVTIRTSDIPEQIMKNAAYYSMSLEKGESKTVTPETALLRTFYEDRQSLETDEFVFDFYQKTLLIVSFYDSCDSMIGYTYVNYGTSVNWPNNIDFVYGFDVEQENILSNARGFVESMIAEADIINEEDVYCRTHKTGGQLQLALKNPDKAEGTEYLCCIWTDKSSGHEEMLTEELASNVRNEGTLKGSDIFDSNTGDLICDMQDERYCLVALIGEGRVTHIGYLDCSRLEK